LWCEEAVSNSEGTTIDKKRLRRLQSRSRQTDPTIWIGKEGPSEDLLKHVAKQLKARELVKLKVQKSALAETETGKMAEKVAASTSSTLIEVMGHTFTLYKRREMTETRRER
jgi:putative YhbY family RNA-binding protein